MLNTGMMSSNSAEYETPQWLFNTLDKKFHFVLDVCATEHNAKCNRYFTLDDDGLSQTWAGPAWMNPPYGREIGRWVRKAWEQAQSITVVGLLPSRTDTQWFHDYIYHKSAIEFVRGRLHFNDIGPAPFPSMIVVWTPRTVV